MFLSIEKIQAEFGSRGLLLKTFYFDCDTCKYIEIISVMNVETFMIEVPDEVKIDKQKIPAEQITDMHYVNQMDVKDSDILLNFFKYTVTILNNIVKIDGYCTCIIASRHLMCVHGGRRQYFSFNNNKSHRERVFISINFNTFSDNLDQINKKLSFTRLSFFRELLDARKLSLNTISQHFDVNCFESALETEGKFLKLLMDSRELLKKIYSSEESLVHKLNRKHLSEDYYHQLEKDMTELYKTKDRTINDLLELTEIYEDICINALIQVHCLRASVDSINARLRSIKFTPE